MCKGLSPDRAAHVNLSPIAIYSFVDGTLSFRGGEESFGFKKLYITRARLVTCLRLSSIDETAVANRRRETVVESAKQVNKIGLLKSFICKEVALSDLNLLRFAYYSICNRLCTLFLVLRLAHSLTTGKPIYATARRRPGKFSFVQMPFM